MSLILLASNNASTVLASSINASATTLTVNTGAGSLFPSPVAGTSFFKLTLIDAATGQLTEIVHVTARTGDVMTIERAQEGTTARAWSANDIAANMMTAGTLSYILGSFQPLDATLTALAALIGAADKLPYFSGPDTAALTPLTGVGRDIIGKKTIADILTYLGLGGFVQDTGAANAVVIASTIVLADGVPFLVKFAAANTGATTIKIGSAAAIPLLGVAGALQGGEIAAGGYGWVAYSSTLVSAVLLSPVYGGALQVKPATKSEHAVQLSQLQLNGSIGSTGWRQNPDGTIEQWGIGVTGSNGSVAITFPVPFPSACYHVSGLISVSTPGTNNLECSSASVTGVTFFSISPSGSSVPGTGFYWRAFGK